MTKTNQKFYAWVGQNATCGTAHPITGNYSMYGRNYVFASKQERDEFVENYYDHNGNKFARSCSKRKLRTYNEGMSVATFEEDLLNQEYLEAN